MFYSLLLSAFMMGLLGGPHCLAMCGVACHAITSPNAPMSSIVQIQSSDPLNALAHPTPNDGSTRMVFFLLGRWVGYAILGGVAAFAINAIAWLSNATAALKPLWTFFHVLVFSWGLLLLLFAKQPIWIDQSGRWLWHKLSPLRSTKQGVFQLGTLWALMPCGLLYSALLVASFQGSVLKGALSMSAFAIGSSLSLALSSPLLNTLKTKRIEAVAMRATGLLLMLTSGWAIWMQLMHATQIWCIR